MKSLLIIMSGLPFSGKTTIAQNLSRKLGIQLLSYDHDIYAHHKSEVPVGTSVAKEFNMIEAIAREQIARKLKEGKSLIYDDLCLEREDRQKLTDLAKECQAKSIIIFVDTPLSIIEHRRKKNREVINRNHISDTKLQLDISLLQQPLLNEDALMITPETSIAEIINTIHARF
jgi:predicted kinase